MTGERSAEPPETAAGALAELGAARAALADTARRMGGERSPCEAAAAALHINRASIVGTRMS